MQPYLCLLPPPVTSTAPYKVATTHHQHRHASVKPPLSPMDDSDSPPPYEVEIQSESQHHEGGKGGLSTSQIIALITLIPTGGTLLLLAGLIFAATIAGLAGAALLFLIFSPVLVPAAVVVGLAGGGFVTSQTLGMTAVWALSCAWDYLRRALASSPARDVADRMGKGHAQKDGPVHMVEFET